MISTPRPPSRSFLGRLPVAGAALLLLLLLGGCEFVGSFIAGTPEAQLRHLAIATWVSEGRLVLGDERIGVAAAVTDLGDGVWEARVADPSVLAGEVVWTVEIGAVRVYRVFPGPEFARFVHETSVERDRRAGLNSAARAVIEDPAVSAVGEVRARYSRSDRGGGGEVIQRATLRVVEPGGKPVWAFDATSRSRTILFHALDLTFETLARQDERVMRCAGSAEYDQDPGVYLVCAGEVLEDDFGSEEGS